MPGYWGEVSKQKEQEWWDLGVDFGKNTIEALDSILESTNPVECKMVYLAFLTVVINALYQNDAERADFFWKWARDYNISGGAD